MKTRKFVAGTAIGLFLLMLASGNIARAGSISACATSTVDNILGTTCTIGDKTFAFDATFTSSMPANEILFTPDATNSNGPGFILSPAPGFSFVVGKTIGGDASDSTLTSTVSITNSASGATISGATVSIVGATGNDEFVTFANNKLSSSTCGTITANAFAEGPQPTPPPPVATSTQLFSSCTTQSVPDSAEFSLFTQDGGDFASLGSAEFNFNEVQSTPEPSSLLLFGSGLLGVVPLIRGRISRRV